MTNEKAKGFLLDLRAGCVSSYGTALYEERMAFVEAIDLAISALERDRWISVEERLPEYGEKCLVAFKLNGHNYYTIQVSYCYVQKEGFWSDCGLNYKAMAWRPLPEPPKEET